MSNITPKESVASALTTITVLQSQLSTLQAQLTVASEKLELGDATVTSNVSAIGSSLDIYLVVTQQTSTKIQSLMHA